MEKKKKIVITVITVIFVLLIILLISLSPNLIKRLTGNASNVNDLEEKQGISSDFINDVCNVSVDNENFLTLTGKMILNTGESGIATVNIKSDNLVFTKEIEVKPNDYTNFTYVLPRDTYSVSIVKDGYKTYQTEISNSKDLNVTLIRDDMESIIASGRTLYNTYYDYYSDGTINIKKVGKFNQEEEIDKDFFYFVLGDALTKYVSNNGLDIKPVSTGEQYEGLVFMLVSMVYSSIVSNQENEGINYRYQFIDANNKIENKECREDNYLTDENCENVKMAYDFLGYANSEVSFDDTVKLVKLIIDMPVPTKVIINDDVQVLPSLAYAVSDEIKINENVMFVSDYTLQNAKIGTLIINSSAINETSVFASNSKINNLIIGNRVTKISNNAFSDSKINNISLPETLTQIGESAFENTKMNAIKLPDNIKSIGKRAFSNCGITEVKLPKNIESIGESAFNNNSITNISIPNKLKKVGSYAFLQNSLSNITFPKGLTDIGESAFSQNKLTFISVPNTVTNLGYYAFSGNEINEVHWDTNASASDLFKSNKAESVKLTIGPNVSVIRNTFSGLKLTELNISYGVKEIGDSAFYNNQYITSVTIPNTVKIIGRNAFNGNKITSITVPASVTEIGDYAFGNNQLEVINFNAKEITKGGRYMFSGNKTQTCNLIIGEGITSIPSYSFTNAGLTSIVIPKSVTTISNNAFSNNNKINEVTIKGDETRFNSNWTNIGFPISLKPGS